MDNIKTIMDQAEINAPAEFDPNRLHYHLMPPTGWLNDPNGLCQKDGLYHLYYQYSPQNANGALKAWGHYTTPDFIHYIQKPIAVYPDSEIDKNGAYSGSAFVHDGVIHYYYTGNLKFPGNHDYIRTGRGHYTNHFTSEDGDHFSEKEALLKNEDYPSDLTCHVRDPKVFEEDGKFYMVLGARTLEDVGQCLLYESDNLHDWHLHSRIESDNKFGFMWECPDLFKLDGTTILITCPQGVDQEGYLYENIYQNGYFVLDGSIQEGFKLSSFVELDNGFDFYAPQTFVDDKGRHILIGWMGMPDADYENPTVEQGWQHAFTLPRELHVKNGRLYQQPIAEMHALERDRQDFAVNANGTVDLKSRVCRIRLEDLAKNFEIRLRDEAILRMENGLFTLELPHGGHGRQARHLRLDRVNTLDIYSDTSSLEVFINDGQHTFSTRLYDKPEDHFLHADVPLKGTLWQMDGFQISKDEQSKQEEN